MTSETEALVIGAGVVGCSVALELARRGVRVTVVDRNGEVGHGSTSASCGIVRRFYSARAMSAMAHESSFLWADWGAYLGAAADEELARFLRPGMLILPTVMDDGLRAIVESMRSLGIETDVLDADELRERFPFLDPRSKAPIRSPDDDDFFAEYGGEVAGIFEHGAGYVVSPTLATVNLRDACLRAGVEFRMGQELVGVEAGEGAARFRCRLRPYDPSARASPSSGAALGEGSARTDETARSEGSSPAGASAGGAGDERSGETELRARILVNVAGPHSSLVNRLVGVELPIEVRPLRKEVAVVANPTASLPADAGLPVVGDLDSGIYCRPEGSADLVVGSLEPPGDPLLWLDDPDDGGDTCSREAFERYTMRLMKRVPDLELGPFRGLASQYDVTTLDWHPVLDRTDRDGYYVAIGTSGSSFKTAPVIGQLMSALIDAVEAGADVDAEPLRLPLPRSGGELDASFFSRLRSARDSSKTVLG